MKKGILVTTILFLLLAVTSFAQWSNQGAWPDTSYKGQNHAMEIDGAGKLWVSNYAADTTINGFASRSIKVFNPDGSHASFSPIIWVQGAGIDDSLKYPTLGMRRDHNGDILLTTGKGGTGALQIMYRFNHQTGAAMNKVVMGFGDGTTPTAPSVDAAGNIYVATVFPGYPIKMFDPDFNSIGNAVDLNSVGFSRSIEVSDDGLTLYHPVYTALSIVIYHRPDELSTFDSVGVISGPACESISWNPATGDLWFSGGSYFNLPDSSSSFTPNTWYGYDVATNSVTDSLKWAFTTPQSNAERPRVITFSLDGNNAYLGCFGGAGYPLIQKVVYTGSSVDEEGQSVVNGYKLSQNYPNPFNPGTKINFELRESGFTTLKIYDMLGNEVATLVNNELTSGIHSVNFNAANLASGTYVYQLNVNGTRITNKMILLK